MLRRNGGAVGSGLRSAASIQKCSADGLDAGALEQSGERHASPCRGAHRAEAPLHAGRRRQIETAAAVAGALDRRAAMLGAHAADVLEPERDRARHLAVDRQRPRRGGLRGQRMMASDEKQIVARLERPQRFDRRLRVERPGVADDQPRRGGASRRRTVRRLTRTRGARRSHQRSGSSQSERERLATADESIAHGPQTARNRVGCQSRTGNEKVRLWIGTSVPIAEPFGIIYSPGAR